MAGMSMLLYTLSFVPQIVENYKCRSGTGLSDYFLLAYVHTYMVLLFYIFGLHINIAYKIACPLQAIAVLILVLQRLYYDGNKAGHMGLMYAANILIYSVFVPIVFFDPIRLGHMFGWISVLLTLVNQVPQIIKIWRSKSVEGFSYILVFVMGLAALCELYSSVSLGLPMQTVISAARGVVYFIVFSFLFCLYTVKR